MTRVYELFLQGEEESMDVVARMLEGGPFIALRPEGQPVGKLAIRSANFGEPGGDEELEQTGKFLCATLRAIAFVQSRVELDVECFGFRIYRDRIVERTVAYSNVFRVSSVEANWMDDFTTPDPRGMKLADKALVSAANDERVRLVMSLCSNPETFGWREIYDVMEAGKRQAALGEDC